MTNNKEDNIVNISIPEAYRDLLSNRQVRYFVYYGGRASGKSYNVGLCLLLLAMQKKHRVLCCRELQTSIADSVHKLLCDCIDRYGLGKFFTITKTTIVGANGSEFIFKGLRMNPREIKSLEDITLCWCEESQTISQESWEILIPTIRGQNSQIILTFNPLNPDDATYERFVTHTPPNTIIKKTTWRDNPYFPEVLREEMEYLKRKDMDAYLHVWEGEPRRISHATVFYNCFTVQDFVTPPDARFFHGVDWGFSTDPTALVRCFIMDKCLFIDQEAYKVGVELDKMREFFLQIPSTKKWIIKADSARPETISYMRRQGFNISAAKKWHGCIEDGIEYIKSFEKIIIHPRCKHTLDEFQHYSYKIDKNTNEILPVIVDADNHCFIKGTMITTAEGQKPIETVTTKDYVLTRDGYKKVAFRGITGRNCSVYTVTLSDGRTITGTFSHRIPTQNRGTVALGRLRQGDLLLCWQQQPTEKQSLLSAKNGTDTQTPKIRQTENIFKKPEFGFTDTHGNSIMVLSPMAIIYTIKTIIQQTITSKISNVLHVKNTTKDILRKKKYQDAQQKETTQCSTKPTENGAKVQREKHGGLNTEKQCLKTSSLFKKFANAAGRYLQQKYTASNSVQTAVKANTEDKAELTTKQEYVLYAEKNTPAANTQATSLAAVAVQTVTDAGRADVYNLTVCETHEYFANGILVLNCCDSLRYALDGMIKGRGGMKISASVVGRMKQRAWR